MAIDSDLMEVVLPTKSDATEVLSIMKRVLTKEGCVSVQNFFDLVGIESAFLDSRRGWRDLESTEIKKLSPGHYLLDFPTPISI